MFLCQRVGKEILVAMMINKGWLLFRIVNQATTSSFISKMSLREFFRVKLPCLFLEMLFSI